MSEYKKDTVGWHLSRLREPLKSRALGQMTEADDSYRSSDFAILWAFDWDASEEGHAFWSGVYRCLQGSPRDCTDPCDNDPRFLEGWDMARECAPDETDDGIPNQYGGKDYVLAEIPAMGGSYAIQSTNYDEGAMADAYSRDNPLMDIYSHDGRLLRKGLKSRVSEAEARISQLERQLKYLMEYGIRNDGK